MKLTFYSDPGHGWLEVPVQLLADLGIKDKVSRYSYRKGEKAYLEEDCDCSLFMQAMKNIGLTVEFRDVVENESSFIRRLQKFYC